MRLLLIAITVFLIAAVSQVDAGWRRFHSKTCSGPNCTTVTKTKEVTRPAPVAIAVVPAQTVTGHEAAAGQAPEPPYHAEVSPAVTVTQPSVSYQFSYSGPASGKSYRVFKRKVKTCRNYWR